jgi:hypothetical protein
VSSGRKVLYFVGAGVPKAAGAFVAVEGGGEIPIPTQAEFWPVFLRLCRSNLARTQIESFLFRYFVGYRRPPYRIKPPERRKLLATVDVEEVFTFLSERTKAPSSSSQLKVYAQRIWDTLVQQVAAVFSRFEPNRQTRQTIQAFHRRHVRSFDALVSFNYDTVLEESLAGKVQWAYHGLEDATDRLSVLKPHGSINWDLVDGKVVRRTQPSKPVVVAPTHLKFVQTSAQGSGSSGYLDQAAEIRTVWEEMEREMRAAKVLVFIGYSFPVADLYFSSVLRSVLADRDGAPDVVIVNPDAVSIAARLQARFSIPRIVKYFDLGQFIDAGRQGVKRAVDAWRAA